MLILQASVDELPPGLVQEVHKKDSVKFPNANYTTGKKKPDLTINIFNSSFENQTNRQGIFQICKLIPFRG